MTFAELVDVARRDDAIVCLVLTGSRGRGYPVLARLAATRDGDLAGAATAPFVTSSRSRERTDMGT